MGSKQYNLEAVEADMTPMIDVVFQLIIFFMTTIRFKALEGKLETQLPKDVGVNSSAPTDVLLKAEIGLFEDKSQPNGFFVTLNGVKVANLTALRVKLTQLKQVDAEMKATLYPNRGINYSQVVKVVDECIKAKMLDITFAGVAFDA
jgi:biopolymer transport protein ExbD